MFAVHGQADSAGGSSATPATWTLKSLLFQHIGLSQMAVSYSSYLEFYIV